MKTLLLILTMVSISSLSFAQMNTSTDRQKIYEEHSQIALNQIQSFLSKNLSYPQHLKKHEVEGRIIVEIRLGKKGNIVKTKIVSGLHPEIDETILNTLKEMKGLDMKGKIYKGTKSIQIPIAYTL